MEPVVNILVVDDETDLCEILRFNLESEGFGVDCAYSAEAALALLEEGRRYRLLLLDVMMERMSGFELARLLRSRGIDIPVIFLTARDAERDLLEGFSAGGDDYITKPFSFPTVLARVRAVLRRTGGDGECITAAGVRLEPRTKNVRVGEESLTLTKKEYKILELLMSNMRQPMSREQIMDQVWEDDAYVGDRSVDVHIARLRKKLGAAGNAIVNHTGFGYAFEPEKGEE